MQPSGPVYWLKNAAYLAGVPIYAGLVRAKAARARTDFERLEITKRLRFRGYTLRSYQIDEEILSLLEVLREHRCKRVVEIGTARGGTLFLILQALSEAAKVVSVDLPSGRFGGGYPHWKIPLFRTLRKPGQLLKLIRGDSHATRTRDRVLAALEGPADFILVDGDHSYEGAKRDFEIYREILAPGGLIAFHDIVPGASEKVGGVPRLWKELREQHRHEEFVKDWNQGGFGIGLLRL